MQAADVKLEVLAPRTWQRKQKRWVVHLPNGDDTWCRMIGTDGMQRRHYRLMAYEQLPAPPLCVMCQTNLDKASKQQQLAAALGTLWQR